MNNNITTAPAPLVQNGLLARVRAYISSQVSFARFSTHDQVLFAKRLSFLIKAGVPIIEALSLIRLQTKSKAKGKVYDAIIADVGNGQYLSTSLGKFKQHFGAFTVNIIRIGEHGGILSNNLIYLAEELAKKQALKRKVYGALVYPAFISLTTLSVTGGLTVFIFPKILPVFISLKVTLPLTTRILLATSIFLQQWGILLIIGTIIGTSLFIFIRTRIYPLERFTDRLILRLPIAGVIAQGYNVANFARTLGLLLRSGIPVVEALTITGDVTSNVVYKEACMYVAKKVIEGETISKNVARAPYLFPDIVTHMIAIGEKTGSLTDSLSYLAGMYESEVEEKTKNLSSSIEPILLVTMGVVVGLIAVSVITPIYDITKNLSR